MSAKSIRLLLRKNALRTVATIMALLAAQYFIATYQAYLNNKRTVSYLAELLSETSILALSGDEITFKNRIEKFVVESEICKLEVEYDVNPTFSHTIQGKKECGAARTGVDKKMISGVSRGSMFTVEDASFLGLVAKHITYQANVILPSIWVTPFKSLHFRLFLLIALVVAFIDLLSKIIVIHWQGRELANDFLEKKFSTSQRLQLLSQTDPRFAATQDAFKSLVDDLSDTQVTLQSEIQSCRGELKARSYYIASISHELRNPLNTVIGYSEHAESKIRSRDYEEAHKHLQLSIKAARLLSAVVSDMIDKERLDLGALDLLEEAIDINDIAAEAVEMTRYVFSGSNVTIHFSKADARFQHVIGDRNRIKQMLINLLNNAMKFTEKGYVELTVHCERQASGKLKVTYTCKDTGRGMSNDQLAQIFQPFYKGKEGAYSSNVGLGLFVTKQIAELYSGSIDVKSLVGIGSTFALVLFLEKPKSGALREPRSDEKQLDELATSILRGRMFFACDDQIENAESIKIYLERYGSTVSVFSDGRSLVEASTHSRPDMIFLDIQMPELDGYETARLIREVLGHEIPIIAVSGRTLKGERIRCSEAGISDFLAKPFTSEMLVRTLVKNLIGKVDSGTLQAVELFTKVRQFPEVEHIDLTYAIEVLGHDRKLVNADLQNLIRLIDEVAKFNPEADELSDMDIHLHKLRNAAARVGASDMEATLRLYESRTNDPVLRTALLSDLFMKLEDIRKEATVLIGV